MTETKTQNDGETLSTDLFIKAETKLYYDLHVPATTPAPLVVAFSEYRRVTKVG